MSEDLDERKRRLELKRRELELQKQRLELEKQKLELEKQQSEGAARAKFVARRQEANEEARGRPMRPRYSTSYTAMMSLLGGVLALASIVALLYAFGDPDKIPLPGLERTAEESASADDEADDGGERDDGFARAAPESGGSRRSGASTATSPERPGRSGGTASADGDALAAVAREAEAEAEAARRAAAEAEARQAEQRLRLAGVLAELEAADAGQFPARERALAQLVASPGFDPLLAREARERLEQARARLVAPLLQAAGAAADAGRRREALAQLAAAEQLGHRLGAAEEELALRLRAELKLAAEAEAAERSAQTRAAERRARSVRTAAHLRAALRWLARHQAPDGRWDADGWTGSCRGQRCQGPGTNQGDARYDVGLSALALMAFIRGGHGPDDAELGETVRRGLVWLAAQQKPNGSLGFDFGETIYNHAIATQALCLGYQAGVAAMEQPARRAVIFCLQAQNPGQGWKYGVQTGRNDVSVTGWMVQALHAAREVGFDVPGAAFAGALVCVDRATSSQGVTGYETAGTGSAFLPQNDGKYDRAPAMTAAGVATRLLAGERASAERVRQGLGILRGFPPVWRGTNYRTVNLYYWHYGTLALDAAGGVGDWRRELLAALLPWQIVGGCADGSWDPVGEWCLAGGRIYSTALAAGMLPHGEPRGRTPAARPKATPEPRPAGLYVVSKLGGPVEQRYVVRGRIGVEGSRDFRDITVTVTFYGAKREVLGVQEAECASTLRAGRKGRFTATLAGAGAVIEEFEVEVKGKPVED